MKVLIDPVYTGLPSTCSTSYLAWGIIEYMIERYEDVYFYLLFPEFFWEDEVQREFVSRYEDRVTLIPITYKHWDRLRELFSFDRELAELVIPGLSPCWDADVILSSRIPQLGMFRVASGREMSFRKGSIRQFYGLEEMPILSFRDTVPWGKPFESSTLCNYLQADGVLVNNLWTAKALKKVAMKHLSPSRVRELMDQVHETIPVELVRLDTQHKTYRDGDPFYVAFTGRMTGTRNFGEIAELFRKQFAYPIGKNKAQVKFVISTNSLSTGSASYGEMDFIDVQYNSREKFHQFLREQAHVVVNLSPVEDFSLSTYEPMKFGVPVIVPNKAWTSFLGEQYPFRVSGETEAYGMISAFVKDYTKMYQRFQSWEQGYWAEFIQTQEGRVTEQVLCNLIDQFDTELVEYLNGAIGGRYKVLVDEAIEEGRTELFIEEYLKEKGMAISKEKLQLTPYSRRPNNLLLKKLFNRAGFRDLNGLGHVKREL